MRGHTFPPQHTHTHLLAIYIAYLEDCYGNRLPVVRGGGVPPQPHLGDERRARTRRKKRGEEEEDNKQQQQQQQRRVRSARLSQHRQKHKKQPHRGFFFVCVVLPVMKWGARRLWEDASARRCCCFGWGREQDTSVIQRRDGEPALTEPPEPPSPENNRLVLADPATLTCRRLQLRHL